jgi:hypothetical protein
MAYKIVRQGKLWCVVTGARGKYKPHRDKTLACHKTKAQAARTRRRYWAIVRSQRR